jgi:hypothetical protein
LDLAGDEVLVNFQNHIWAGSWAQTVGSEVYVNGMPRTEEEEEEEEEEIVLRGAPRATGGGYYYSEKDFSAAAPLVGKRGNKNHKKKIPQAKRRDEMDGEKVVLPPEVGRVVAVGRERVHFAPAAVKAKEWTFAEQLQGKSDFLKRLERIQIMRGEMEREAAQHLDGKKRRRRKKGKGVQVDGKEVEGEEEEWEEVEISETDDEEEEEEGGQGYFARSRQRQTGEASSPAVPAEGTNVDMVDAPPPPPADDATPS